MRYRNPYVGPCPKCGKPLSVHEMRLVYRDEMGVHYWTGELDFLACPMPRWFIEAYHKVAKELEHRLFFGS